MSTDDPVCNFCGNSDFAVMNGRPAERCKTCGSLCRHRTALATYEAEGMFDGADRPPYGCRVLHLAPEKCLHTLLTRRLGTGYMPADAAPEAYPYAQSLRVFLPEGLDVFPDEYFDFIIHNHVMEHIPGPFQNTLMAQFRVLKIGGRLIFSIPGPRMSQDTVEGGEFMASDDERMAVFGQANHLKRFGRDLPGFMEGVEQGQFRFDALTWQERVAISVRPGSDRVMVWEKLARSEWDVSAMPERYAAGAARAHLNREPRT